MNITDDTLRQAADFLAAGELVAFPTETVYGLGADAFNPAALARVFEVKRRPRFDPLIIHISGLEDLERVADIASLTPLVRKQAADLCRCLWPGPLTLILPKIPSVPDLATSGLPTVAVRFPAHPIAQKLIRLLNRAVAAPSANPFGYLSPTSAEHVREQLGDQIAMILDGGPADIGVESTVLDLAGSTPRILRPGGTPKERIEAVIGPLEAGETSESAIPCSPGQLKNHYAPKIPLILHGQAEMSSVPYNRSEGYLFFSSDSRSRWTKTQQPDLDGEGESRIRTLSEAGNMPEAAANLFKTLHELDKLEIFAIHAEQVPNAGLGNAVNDRLFRGAAVPFPEQNCR
ncbi:MAG: threonylcarbamoyl-AMP synthase [Treponema sp.]|jgi:L-threonylcarbamoyladenylate synthase|nr:threonylcarbamoyl-AMP synthase [Treponema sp.]